MSVVEATPRSRDVALALRKRRCPDCGSYLFLESVYGEGYWWNCLICGWSRPTEMAEQRQSPGRAK